MDMGHKPWRETPLIESAALSKAVGCRVLLKLDNLQPSGAFKSRGVGNYVLSRVRERRAAFTSTVDDSASGDDSWVPDIHFYSSSGGNAGLAAVCAAVTLNCPCTVVVPTSTSSLMIGKIRQAGAQDVVQEGASWKEADAYLRDTFLKNDPKGVYVPPFDHPDIWDGNSTIIPECMRQFQAMMNGPGAANSDSGYLTPETENGGMQPAAIVCSVGGGGLFNGISQALRGSSPATPLGWSHVPVVAVETHGAHSLAASIAADEHITLDAITSKATTLGARRVSERTWNIAKREVRSGTVKSVVLSDDDAAYGCVVLAEEERMLVELSCGVNVAMCFDGRLQKALGRQIHADECVILVVCGGKNVTVEMVQQWQSAHKAKINGHEEAR